MAKSKQVAAGGLSGAASGAMAGAALAAPTGGLSTLAGAGIGLLAGGGVGAGLGMLGDDGGVAGYSKGDLEYLASVRSRQIDDFATQLTAARQRYMAQLPAYQNYVMSRFMPQVEATYATRGLQVGGGAFASTLAKKAADLQAEQMMEEYNRERADLVAVDSARAALAGAQLGGGYANFAGPAQDTAGQLAGRLVGSGLSVASDMYANKPKSLADVMSQVDQTTPVSSWAIRDAMARKSKLNLAGGGGWATY